VSSSRLLCTEWSTNTIAGRDILSDNAGVGRPVERRLEQLDAIARRLVVEPRVAPAAAVAIAAYRNGHWRFATGAAGHRTWTRPEPVSPETPFDLASVTKSLVAVTLATLARTHELHLDMPLGALLAPARATASAAVSLETLLAHRAGLDAHRSFFEPLRKRRALVRDESLAEAAAARRANCAGAAPAFGFPPVYSDLGYLLAGEAASRAAKLPLDELVRQQVAAPLGLALGSARQWIARDAAFAERVAPTEHVAWRGGLLQGVVHDENAWALGGHGCCGHAGLFGTAPAVARFGAAVLDAARGAGNAAVVSRTAVEPLLRPRAGGTLLAGFDAKAASGSTAGERCGPHTFGHLGFTGTSFWCDPEALVTTVLLTNRVCPTRNHLAIRAARPQVHDALFALATALDAEE
jgi:CubicO group peptidase (beta-lactamase class C family)